MSYNENYNKSMETYKKLVSEYETIVGSEKYKEVCDSMPFDFLNANQKVETLKLFHSVGETSKFHFKRADDAISFMYGFVDVRKGMAELLDGASYIASAEAKANEINRLVENSSYLPSNLCVPTDGFIFGIARECLKVLPEYPNLMNMAFKKAYVESCIDSLSISGLQKLVQAKIITKNDIMVVRASGSAEYKEKMNALREAFGMEHLFYEKHNIKVVGTSFNNEDGSSRQEILGRMKDSENVELTTKKGIFVKAPGVEKKSVAIKWDKQTIGYVPQGTVDEMYSKYDNPEFESEFKEVTGGGDISYGCNVELGIVAKEFAKEEPSKEEPTVSK